jgi:hypothetical protein
VLIDHYEEDWTKLWWVRLRGRAHVIELDERVLQLLAAKYPQYREAPPRGPLIELTIEARTEWRATPPG